MNNHYLKAFKTNEEYLSFRNSSSFILPNVSATVLDGDVFFNPEIIVPRNSIYYVSTEKLNFNNQETWFNYYVDQYELLYHTWDSTTGKGVIAFNKNMSEITFQFGRALQNPNALIEIRFPDSITKYYAETLFYLSNLKRVYLGNGFTTVDFTYGSILFNGCPSLEYVDLGRALIHLSTGIFSYVDGIGTDCPNINTIMMPNVSTISDFAFCNCDNLSQEMIEKISAINPAALSCEDPGNIVN